MKKISNRDTLRQLLPTLSDDDQAWLRQQLLGWKDLPKLHDTAHLHPQELLALESWLWQRYGEAQTMREKLPRLRNWFIFMLLRHAGLLPNEIFSLTPASMNWNNNSITVSNEHGERHVPLAPHISRRMHKVCVDMAFPANSHFLRCDDGFMRRSLQQCAAACGMPAGVVNARSLRRHRAQELLQQGIPLPVVDIFLGRSTNASNTLMRYNAEAAMELLQNHLQADRPMKSSARNIFQGRITTLENSGILIKVVLTTASGLEVTSLITDVSCKRLELTRGKLVNASVKAPWVMVEALSPESLAQRASWPENSYLAEVESSRHDNMVMEVLAKLEEGSQICAIQNVSPSGSQPLQAGTKVRIHFNAFSVILNM